jgi:SAM-dependent methyltransferase
VTPGEALFDSLRLGRTLGLHLLEPFDRLRRAALGRMDLPPLWLRRHAGPVAEYDRAVADMETWLDRLGLVLPGDLVLDLGCGAGSMAAALGRRIGSSGRYIGIDVHRPSVQWAARRFASDARFRFETVEVASPYGSRRPAPARPNALPVANGAAQFVLAKSLFTHLLEPEAAAYLSETRRVLEPGRAAFVSAFLFEPGSRADRGFCPWFRHPEPGYPVRFRFRYRPQAAVAYERSRFVSLVEQAGLRVQWICPGYLPGNDRLPRGQDLLLLGH